MWGLRRILASLANYPQIWKRSKLFDEVVIDLHHTIQKVKFLSKNSILTKPQHFREFFTQIFFLTIFLVKSKLSTAKKPKTTSFSPKKIDKFFGKSMLNFWTKKWRFRTVCPYGRDWLLCRQVFSFHYGFWYVWIFEWGFFVLLRHSRDFVRSFWQSTKGRCNWGIWWFWMPNQKPKT